MSIRAGVFQDRFVKALRLRQINTLESANTYLEEEFLDELNARLHVTARSPSNLHRPVPRGVTLAQVLCYQEPRVVQNDWTVSWCHRIFQWGVTPQKLALARQKILVSELRDGTLQLIWKGRPLSWTEVCTRPAPPRPSRSPQSAQQPRLPTSRLPPIPWRRRFL